MVKLRISRGLVGKILASIPQSKLPMPLLQIFVFFYFIYIFFTGTGMQRNKCNAERFK